MYPVKTPGIVKALYHDLEWKIQHSDRGIYLTFDDGPSPEVTPQVLDILKQFQAKATFFCIGDKVQKHPELFNRIIAEGHRIGNHTYHHKNGWKTKNFNYYKNVLMCDQLVSSKLFRPPYGRILRSQSKVLKKRFRIIMWSVLSGDFDVKTNKETCLKNVLQNTKSGSIVVFHDSPKSKEKVLFALPKVLHQFTQSQYQFLAIPD